MFTQQELRKDLIERFPRYCRIDSGSVDSETVPSTEVQTRFAEVLAAEAKGWGYQAELFPFGLRVRAPANVEGVTPIAFGAHLDTSDDAPNKGVQVVPHMYQGGDINVGTNSRGEPVIISSIDYKGLSRLEGDLVFTSNGKTLLGGDDKAGVAEIMTALKMMAKHNLPHGEIDVLFTYDEETGLNGALTVDPKVHTNAQALFVFDSEYGALGVSSFNAAGAYLTLNKTSLGREYTGTRFSVNISGIGTFPGHGKTKGMVDAFRTLPEVIDRLLAADIPVVGIKGGISGIELEVVVDETLKLPTLDHIVDDRFRDERRDHPVRYTQGTEVVSVTEALDLNPLATLVRGIPYSISAEQTEKLQGYMQPYNISQKEGHLVVFTLLRDFETAGLEAKKALAKTLVPEIVIKDQYMNKRDVLQNNPEVIAIAQQAMLDAGVPQVELEAVRGGDESGMYTLSKETMMGKPEPGRRIPSVNVGAFDDGFHTEREHVGIGTLVTGANTVYNIVKAYLPK